MELIFEKKITQLFEGQTFCYISSAEVKSILGLLGPYDGCCCPGSMRCQDISSFGIEYTYM